MNAFSKIDMGEVTRLTQAGKLAEAMALLQGHTASTIARSRPGSDVPRWTPGIKRPSLSMARKILLGSGAAKFPSLAGGDQPLG